MSPWCLQYGKGKWKKIVQEGGEMFQNRTAVDLKVGGCAGHLCPRCLPGCISDKETASYSPATTWAWAVLGARVD